MSRTLDRERLLDQTRRKHIEQTPPAESQPAAAEKAVAPAAVAPTAKPQQQAAAPPIQPPKPAKQSSRAGRWLLLAAIAATGGGLYAFLQNGMMGLPLPPSVARPATAVRPTAAQPPAAAEKPEGVILRMQSSELQVPLAAHESLLEPRLPAQFSLTAPQPFASLPDPRSLAPAILAVSASSLLRRMESAHAARAAGFIIDIRGAAPEVARTLEVMDASVQEMARMIFRTVQLKEGSAQTAKAD